MATRVGVGKSKHSESYQAGYDAAHEAWQSLGKKNADLAIVFINFVDVIGELSLDEFSGIFTGDDHGAEVRQVTDDIAIVSILPVAEHVIKHEKSVIILFRTVLE